MPEHNAKEVDYVPRLPKLEGAFNFRDVGGLPVRGGGRTREGRLFRSDTLQALTDEDVRTLVAELGIGTVVDLRAAHEAITEGRGPLAKQSTVYLNVSLPVARNPIPAAAPGQMTTEIYLRNLEPASSLSRAIALIAAAIDRPLVVHCAAGKDRTGVTVAVLLDIIGVEQEAIVADYLATAPNLDRMNERFETWTQYRLHRASMPTEIYRIEEAAIRLFLDGLYSRYGGGRQWALDSGVDPVLLDLLTRALVER
ncbi:tyrosine-protein phosphatase [Nocardia sp. CA-120079]|uniref:tyrosine-protein phosphatase n=1 Tax=Nocardia sp. CA-120079 TaxID=3239974 RepID=UPI003D958D79